MSSSQWCNNTLSKNVVANWEQANLKDLHGGVGVANATRQRPGLEALSHVVGNKRGVYIHSCSGAEMTDF